MKVEVKYRSSFNRYFKIFVFITLAFVVGVIGFAFSDEDGYFFLVNNAVKSGGRTASNLIQSLLKNGEDESGGRGGPKVGKSGTNGINLNLIDRINPNTPKKGWIKEYLSFMRDNQKGQLNGYSEGSTVASTLGLHQCEVGGGWYFSKDSWKKDSKDHSFAGFTSKSKKSQDIDSGDVSFMAWTHGESSFKYKANIDPVNNQRKWDHGDPRFFPDGLAYLTKQYHSAKDTYKNSGQNAVSMVSCLINNRGSVTQQMTGVYYGTSGNSKASNAFKKMSTKEKSEMLDYLCEPFDNAADKAKSNKVDQGNDGYCRSLACIVKSKNSDKWFINNAAYNHAKSGGYVSTYKSMFGAGGKSDDEILKELHKHVATSLASSINDVNGTSYNSAYTKAVYDVADDYQANYYNSSCVGYGYIWFVSDKKVTGVYSKPAYCVIAMDGVTFRYAYNTSGAPGAYKYAELLKEAGVNSVDPTDVKTYMNQFYVEPANGSTKKAGTFTASGAKLGTYRADKVLINPKLVDFDSLKGKRYDVVNTAIQMAGSKQFVYDWGGRNENGNGNKTYYARKIDKASSVSNWSYSRASTWYSKLKYPKYGVDCSGFIYACYNTAGVKTGYCACRSGLRNGTSYWRKIDRSQLKPGDIMASGTHVVMFMGQKNGIVQTIEAKQSGTRIQCYYESTHSDKQGLRHRNINK